MKISHPLHPEEITPGWITYALREGGLIEDSTVKDIEKETIGGGKGFLSSVVKVDLKYENKESGAPGSVVVKIEPENELYRNFTEKIHAFEREILFYKNIAKHINLRLPEVFYTVDKPPAYCLVMEDLSAYTPGNQVIGMHHNRVIDTVKIIARIQAEYWNNQKLDDLDWMPFTNSIIVNDELWESFIDNYSQFLSDSQIAIGKKIVKSAEWLRREKAGRPRTIVHCDLREDNLMFGGKELNNEILIIDWQATIRNIGAFDVARLVGGSELILERQGHEFEVLQHWYKELLDNGVKGYSWDDAVYDFKLGALFCLCLPIFFHKNSLNLKGRVKNLREAMIRGHFSSVEEIDAVSILP